MFATVHRVLGLLRRALVVGGLAVLVWATHAGPARAEDWPEVPVVPSWLPDQVRTAFEAQAAALVERAAALQVRAEQFEKKCADVVVGSDLDRECAREHAKIEAANDEWIADVKALGVRLDQARANRTKYLVDLEARYSDLLGKMKDDDKWKAELDGWVKESQDAQLSAIRASLSLVLAKLGPLESAIAGQADEQARLLAAYKGLGPSVQKARAALKAAQSRAATPELTAALARVERAQAAIASSYRDVAELRKVFENLKELASATQEATERVEQASAVLDPLARRDLSDALRVAQGIGNDIVTSAVKEGLAERLVAAGRSTAVKSLGLLEWGVDYGYASLQFATAWHRVNDILGQVDDKNAAMASIREEHRQVVEELALIRSDGARK